MSAQERSEEEKQLAADIGSYTHDPLGYVKYAYPWGEGELEGENGPREWQAEFLTFLGAHLANPETRYMPLQMSVGSGHGIGKTALIAWVTDWALSTHEDCKVVLTTNTDQQMRTKTWPEVKKWHHLSINEHWWRVTGTAIISREPKRDGSWRADTVTWSEKNTEAFAGLHNKRKRIVIVFDEASSIADKVYEVTEGALTDENTEIIWIVFGNTTRTTGRFRECFGKFAHRWYQRRIDSRKVDGTNKAQIQRWLEDWGEDSDFFRIRVRGEFPRASSNQFISSDKVAAARKYKAAGYETLPKILSVDVARFGDDKTVIGVRQGRKFTILAKLRGLSTDQVAGRAIEFIEELHPDLTVVDGGGVGGGVIDTMRARGFGKKLHEFNGGSSPDDAAKYFNKRAEVWGLTRDWIHAGAEIPDDAELGDDLTQPAYFLTAKNQIQLESKDDMKGRGLMSPDDGDCLAMTFAVKVAAPQKQKSQYSSGNHGAQGWMA